MVRCSYDCNWWLQFMASGTKRHCTPFQLNLSSEKFDLNIIRLANSNAITTFILQFQSFMHRHIYDQLAVLKPILMSLTASTPFLKGKISDFDCRWSVISQSVD
eukprot:39687_1